MPKDNKATNISDADALRESVRRIVSEHVYNMIKESIYEQYFESDDKEDEKDNVFKKSERKKENQAFEKERKQVTTMLRDPKINMAELGRDLYPDMSDDASRSLISKKSRGVRELTPEEVVTLYQKLRGTKVGG